MKVALTGSSGLLGSSIERYCYSHKISVIPLASEVYRDKKKIGSLKSTLKEDGITVLIHCAANTNVEQCEVFPEQCYRDNYFLSESIANLCEYLKIKLVFISSTGIYGEAKRIPYSESDAVTPTTVHHRSKWLAEQAIAAIMSDYLIIRTGWLFGGDWQSPKNFVANRIREAAQMPDFIESNASQFGCPTYAEDVSKCIFDLLLVNAHGTYNCVNEGYASRYQYVSAILEMCRYPVIVNPVSEAMFNRKARVSKNEMAENKNLMKLIGKSLPAWRQSLETYLILNSDHWKKN